MKEREKQTEYMNKLFPIVIKHNEEKHGLDVGCMMCTVKALTAIEDGNRIEKQAKSFLARLGKKKAHEHLAEMRISLGQDAPAWMFKEEYL